MFASLIQLIAVKDRDRKINDRSDLEGLQPQRLYKSILNAQYNAIERKTEAIRNQEK